MTPIFVRAKITEFLGGGIQLKYFDVKNPSFGEDEHDFHPI